jgi:hypothetical protein
VEGAYQCEKRVANWVRRERERKANALNHPVGRITRVDEAEPIEEGGSLIRLDEASRSGRRRNGGASTRCGGRGSHCVKRGRAESAVMERELSEQRKRTRAAARCAPHATFSVRSEDEAGVTACMAGEKRHVRGWKQKTGTRREAFVRKVHFFHEQRAWAFAGRAMEQSAVLAHV